NPWAPTKCGQHGYIFPPEDVLHLIKGEIHLFIGVGGQFAYCGLYQVSRCKPLSLDEWNRLSDWVRQYYARFLTALRDNDLGKDDVEIRRLYDSGELLIPCYMLKCVEFNAKLNDELKAAA
ncbi:hypothetical protein WOLCODRAFT_59235, partial [Wolfiporia cocos MD-104 SS10]